MYEFAQLTFYGRRMEYGGHYIFALWFLSFFLLLFFLA